MAEVLTTAATTGQLFRPYKTQGARDGALGEIHLLTAGTIAATGAGDRQAWQWQPTLNKQYAYRLVGARLALHSTTGANTFEELARLSMATTSEEFGWTTNLQSPGNYQAVTGAAVKEYSPVRLPRQLFSPLPTNPTAYTVVMNVYNSATEEPQTTYRAQLVLLYYSRYERNDRMLENTYLLTV